MTHSGWFRNILKLKSHINSEICFRIEFLIGPSVVLAFLINHDFSVLEVKKNYLFINNNNIFSLIWPLCR